MEIEVLDTAPPPKKTNYIGKILLGTLGVTTVALTAITLPFILPALRKICLPYVPATSQAVNNVFKLITRHRPNSATILDLGSGDGRIVIEGAKLGFKSVGVELNPWLVAYSKYKAFPFRKSATFYCSDLWKFNMKPYDVIVIFGVEEMLPQLRNYIIKQKTDISSQTKSIKSSKLMLKLNQITPRNNNQCDQDLSYINCQTDVTNKMSTLDQSEANVLVICSRFKFSNCDIMDEAGFGIDTAWAFNLKNLQAFK